MFDRRKDVRSMTYSIKIDRFRLIQIDRVRDTDRNMDRFKKR